MVSPTHPVVATLSNICLTVPTHSYKQKSETYFIGQGQSSTQVYLQYGTTVIVME